MTERRWLTRHSGPAVFSPCERYRYRLERILGPGPALGVVMINPSRATADLDDPTIDRVQAVCSRLGFGRAIIGNLFAWRTSDVAELAKLPDPVGPDNDAHLEALAREADTILVAWGAPGPLFAMNFSNEGIHNDAEKKLVGGICFGSPTITTFLPRAIAPTAS